MEPLAINTSASHDRSQKPNFTEITLPYSEENMRRLSLLADHYSPLLQQLEHYRKDINHIRCRVHDIPETPPTILASLSPTHLEHVFLQLAALYRLARQVGIVHIDFLRFYLQDQNRVTFHLFPRSGQMATIQEIVDLFKQNKHMANLEPGVFWKTADHLKQKHWLDESSVYAYRHSHLASRLLQIHTPASHQPASHQPATHIIARIRCSRQSVEQMIKFRLRCHYFNHSFYYLETDHTDQSLPQFLARSLPGSPAYDPRTPFKTITDLQYYLETCDENGFVLVADRVETREDAEFLHFLSQSPQFPSTVVIVFQCPDHLMGFDLELKEEPQNMLEPFLNFNHQRERLNPTPAQTRLLRLLELLPAAPPLDYSLLDVLLDDHAEKVIAPLISEGVLEINGGHLMRKVSADNPDSRRQYDDDSAFLETYLQRLRAPGDLNKHDDHSADTADIVSLPSTPHQQLIRLLSAAYYIKARKKEELKRLLRDDLYVNHGNTSFSSIRPIIDEGMQLLADDPQALRLILQLLLKEHDLKAAESIIETHLQKDYLNFSLKSARINLIRRDYSRLKELLDKLKPNLRNEDKDEWHYLSFALNEKYGKREKADQHYKKIKSPFFSHLAALTYSDRHFYQGRPEKARQLIEPAAAYFESIGFPGERIAAEIQLAKLARETQKPQAAEQMYKNAYVTCRMQELHIPAANIACDLGVLYFNGEHFSAAENWFKKALEIFKNQKNEPGIQLMESNLAEIFRIKGDWVACGNQLNAALKYNLHRNQPGLYSYDYFNLAQLAFLRFNLQEAKKRLPQALEIFKERKEYANIIECRILETKMALFAHHRAGKEGPPILGLPDSEFWNTQPIKSRLTDSQKTFIWLTDQIILPNRTSHHREKILKRIDAVPQTAQQFEFLWLASLFIPCPQLFERLRVSALKLCEGERRYHYYEYYYLRFAHLSSSGGIPRDQDDLFRDMYYYFVGNGRMMPVPITAHMERIEASGPGNPFQYTDTADLLPRWKTPDDFFSHLVETLSKNAGPQLIRLDIWENGEEVLTFAVNLQGNKSGRTFDQLAAEVVRAACSSATQLNLDNQSVKARFTCPEKAFYHFGNTQVLFWQLSDTLRGIFFLAFSDPQCKYYDFLKRNSGLLEKFGQSFALYYREHYKLTDRLGFIVGDGSKMTALKKKMLKIGPSGFPVLITGESGSGKELVARGLHLLSLRANRPFIPVNASAIPDTLLEAELFGYKKGAFTGAVDNHAGLIETANGGTLFLDEIADLPLLLQAKLLRVLQEKKIRPLGAVKTVDVDFRLLSATNKDLEQMERDGTFRGDLYYRLSDLCIHVPPLRERIEDIPLLAEHFFQKYNFSPADPEEVQRIHRYLRGKDWPGNVRQLESEIKRLITYYPDIESQYEIHVGQDQETGLIAAREKFERELVLEALVENGRNLTATARDLRISRQYLTTLIKKYELVI